MIKNTLHRTKQLLLPHLSKRMIILLIILAVVFGGIVGYNLFRGYMMGQYFASFEPPPITVSAVNAKEENWQSILQTVGSFVAIDGVDISAQATGIVEELSFESGEHVKAGAPLLVINDDVDQATLKSNMATLLLKKLNFERQIRLKTTGFAAMSSIDQARADLDNAAASVQQIEATIAQKHIKAPFDGKLGIRQVSLGQYITPGQTVIVTLQRLDPLYLQFYVPEQQLPNLYEGQPIVFYVDALPKKPFSGKITAINSKIDTNTHNVLVQATVNNQKKTHSDDFAFAPGMFAKIDVLMAQKNNAIVLPLTAVSYTLYGDSVYVIEKKKEKLRVYRRFVTTGEKRGNQVVVLSGLKTGEQVVQSGQLKLHDGTAVSINNQIMLEDVKNVSALGQ